MWTLCDNIPQVISPMIEYDEEKAMGLDPINTDMIRVEMCSSSSIYLLSFLSKNSMGEHILLSF